jgi:arylsulfatase A-like enzyme
MIKRILICLSVLVLPAYFVIHERFPEIRLIPSGHRCNVVFITVDTLRADHTPFGDYKRQTMPATAKFFQDGINFRSAETTRSQTTPAFSSIFSGLYPYHHGVRNLMFQLNPQIETLTEILKREGYFTAAFVSSFVMNGELSGFNQGFDLYDDYVDEKRPFGENYERKAARTIDRSIHWLHNRKTDTPFFLFLHLIDPHGPYVPPEPFSKQFHSEDSKLLPVSLMRKYLQVPGDFELYHYIDAYDGEIRYTDSQLERLYKVLAPLRENTWIVFLADHGESFSEHAVPLGHGHSCFESETRVPFVWLPPLDLKQKYPAAQIQDPVSLVDVAPTIFEALKIGRIPKMDGKSLSSYLKGGPSTSHSVFISLRTEENIFAIRKDNLKIISWKSNTPRESIFNVISDPIEEKDLIASIPRSAKLRQDLQWYYEESRSYRTPFQVKRFWIENSEREKYILQRNQNKINNEDREKLKALGYVD